MFKKTVLSLALGAAFPWLAGPAFAQTPPSPGGDQRPERIKSLGVMTVTGGQPTSLPTQIPTTIEGVTREEIETRINATDSEDALKYLPSLLVRKRYIGDYNHAILSTRASGTGNSARSAVYADGILLSNYLGNGIANGTNYAPRWGLVTPEEIERVDVMYGPFSAAYPGNSAGAVVDYVTRMPTRLEAHVKAGYFSQPFDLYGTHQTFDGWQTSASLGSRSGDWSWWIDVNRTDSRGQPLTFTTATLASGVPGRAGAPVAGAVPGLNTTRTPWYILGTGTAYRTVQDHAKLKLAYDFSPTIRATYTLGWWQNSAEGRPASYLVNAAGQPVFSGPISIGGRGYTLAPTAFPLTNDGQTHYMHGLSVKSNTRGEWDWEVAASLYDYARDRQRAPTGALPLAAIGGTGTLQDQDGTGWNTLAAKGTWRPQGVGGAHIVDFGIGRDAYKLAIVKNNVLGSWLDGPVLPGSLVSNVGGRSRTQSAWVQDSWGFAPRWKAVLGLRYEHWEAKDGFTATGTGSQAYAARSESDLSPKAALAWQLAKDTVLKASLGRAVRYPTVGELYGATAGGALSFINDPNLKPEKSWTGELSAEKDLGSGLARATLFHETTKDALYSQLIPNSTVSRVQNVDKVRTTGLELAYTGQDVWVRGLDLGGSVTYADSTIVANAAFPASIGKWQPRVPRWRSTVYASYKPDARWAFTVAARYSGRQYSNLDNSDVNANAYFGASRYFTVDLRVRYRIDKHWSAAFGIDNANNEQYWNFHPYPQRTYSAELRFDL
ncbi:MULTISPECIES: TonB-dependent receptor [unclassified Variovorax]|uniref:TonB-dependent receptor n=1 Tax=unclassified Variovorax TaxID=663243 RepID=UPI00076BFD0F|nr:MULTISPECIES: TonB-dependent receptor [unclassified Variovorax]KWT97886.1 Outer membrane receptor protein [Variovorax sp. WDL1]PNG59276.1 Vitamin B12 transporter BtuB [Variovorax sp. B4]PNG60933.1 Vitamin B12 transporter BtuB [Variovorax sp. B2]VTV13139.1 enterobactin receptor protein [Variovorax sp. WDL1]